MVGLQREVLGLFLAAGAFLPIGLAGWTPPEGAEPAFWVLWLLAASIGPLFFVVAAQAPLLQRWYGATGEGDPYPLYAASNVGSFAGLIAYPLLAEPLLTLKAQSLLWSLGYGALFFLVYASARRLPVAEAVAARSAVTEAAPNGRRMLLWTALAAIPSGLMLATTLYLTTDIVAMPLLWVMPLVPLGWTQQERLVRQLMAGEHPPAAAYLQQLERQTYGGPRYPDFAMLEHFFPQVVPPPAGTRSKTKRTDAACTDEDHEQGNVVRGQ